MPGIVRETPAPRAGEDAWHRLALDAVTAADEAGFAITLIAQRFLGPDLEAWIQSAALAQATRRIHIMTAIHPIFWNPQLTAKMGASLDRVSGGRFDINLVTGWFQEEQVKYGGEPIDEQRYERSVEFIQVIRALWSRERVTFHGKHYTLDDVPLHMRPVGSPCVYTTTRSEEGRDMAAQVGDWWFVPCNNELNLAAENLASMRRDIQDMRERAERYGRGLRFCVSAWLIHNEDEQEASRVAESIYRHGLSGGPTKEKQTINKIHSNGLGIGLIGSRNRILDRAAELEEIGVEMALLRIEPIVAAVHDIGEHILPELVRRAGAGVVV
jgi:FMNH2-dependent dimethyl sulfone monooxygenase